jgi:hypothetical protein
VLAVKTQSPLLGFNNNVKHKGRLFHIQTEDSGIRHPHIITHLFADGGRILKTTKTSYAEHVGNDAMSDTVTAMMKEQHKAMFIALRDGRFDHMVDPNANVPGAAKRELGIAPTVPGMLTSAMTAQLQAEAAAKAMGVATTLPAPEKPAAVASSPAPPQVKQATPQPAAAAPKDPPGPVVRGSRPRLQVDASAALHGLPTPRSTSPIAVVAAPAREGSLDLDLDALERAAVEAQTPFFQQLQDLPPPPAAVLGKKAPKDTNLGSYRTVSPAPPSRHGAPPAEGAAAHRAAPPPSASASPDGPQIAAATMGRYAASRPAAIFANTRPQEGASIFGEELISEKSLDEVILSYLAEDLEPPPKK